MSDLSLSDAAREAREALQELRDAETAHQEAISAMGKCAVPGKDEDGYDNAVHAEADAAAKVLVARHRSKQCDKDYQKARDARIDDNLRWAGYARHGEVLVKA